MPAAIAAIAFAWLLISLDRDRDREPAEAPCRAAWQAADVDRDGLLDGREATPYLALMHLNAVPWPADGRIARDRFLALCARGAFHTSIALDDATRR